MPKNISKAKAIKHAFEGLGDDELEGVSKKDVEKLSQYTVEVNAAVAKATTELDTLFDDIRMRYVDATEFKERGKSEKLDPVMFELIRRRFDDLANKTDVLIRESIVEKCDAKDESEFFERVGVPVWGATTTKKKA
jgi:hypothetical protein